MFGSLLIPPTLGTSPVFALGWMEMTAGTSDLYVFLFSGIRFFFWGHE